MAWRTPFVLWFGVKRFLEQIDDWICWNLVFELEFGSWKGNEISEFIDGGFT